MLCFVTSAGVELLGYFDGIVVNRILLDVWQLILGNYGKNGYRFLFIVSKWVHPCIRGLAGWNTK